MSSVTRSLITTAQRMPSRTGGDFTFARVLHNVQDSFHDDSDGPPFVIANQDLHGIGRDGLLGMAQSESVFLPRRRRDGSAEGSSHGTGLPIRRRIFPRSRRRILPGGPLRRGGWPYENRPVPQRAGTFVFRLDSDPGWRATPRLFPQVRGRSLPREYWRSVRVQRIQNQGYLAISHNRGARKDFEPSQLLAQGFHDDSSESFISFTTRPKGWSLA